ncbi:MAG: hypothetical protein CME33_04270 [Gimesia sp.]|uniref:hypothetical protein n=1 Tax=Gimesia sp. TaxID=2024833 RepID=UPI000C48DAB6|nr:hypothetical protein [Gimesia sp.]MAX35768.1 hypothetical protein [Gimesia sp.]|tara:strand:+ start:8941 stop:9312 length:372 start_codon:yes stop_codon:yes gene_type:complete
MQYFYITDDNALVLIHSFEIRKEQSKTFRKPSLGGDVFNRGRLLPDTFNLSANILAQEGHTIMITDEDFNVYECIVSGVFVSQGMTNINGYVFYHWVVDPQDQTEVKEKMERAMKVGDQGIRV